MRVNEHPILNFGERKKIEFTFNGKKMFGYEGDTVAAALVDNGIMEFSKSVIHERPRGFYCAIGNCGSCNMTVNGIENVKTCLTLLESGMVVKNDSDEVVVIND
ncbi:MAG: (2Fe-2S)-binding protein [Candidatus Izemoplasmatales bacterium]|nr:(2Fe-2S)-binding protein [Candidatus Izemoplasmatales bacterium]